MLNYYILNDLNGYGNAEPICVGEREAKRLMRGWYEGDDAPEFEDVWADATIEQIERYGISAEGIRTLQDLTGQESGIVIYADGTTIVCNWSAFGDYEFPVYLPGSLMDVIGDDRGEDIFEGAQVTTTDDWYKLTAKIGNIAALYSVDGDIGTNSYDGPRDAVVITLRDGTRVVCPEGWN